MKKLVILYVFIQIIVINILSYADDIETQEIAIDEIKEPIKCQVKIRSAQEPKEAIISSYENNKVKVEFIELQNPIAKGQSAVFYDEDIVIGGGIIEEVF